MRASLAGAIAQLGERYNGIVEVGGSIPPSSTKITNYLGNCWFLLGVPFV